MTDKELSIMLRKDARRLGLCDQWYESWSHEMSKQDMIDLYLKGLDFCIEHRWPTKSFCQLHFDQELRRQNGILIDDTRSYPVRNPDTRRLIYLRNYVLMGDSSATIRYSFRPHMCNVWVLDDSKVRVEAKYGAFILIHLFDNASADVFTDLVSKCTVIKHHTGTSVKREGCVTVREEFNYI